MGNRFATPGGGGPLADARGHHHNKMKRPPVPAALREAVWLRDCGQTFEHKCLIRWCPNKVTVFNFQVAHDVPHSRGGPTALGNLFVICANCNRSMSDTHTRAAWDARDGAAAPVVAPAEHWRRWICC